MSAQASDNNFIAFNIFSQDKFQHSQNVPSLREVSLLGKIWDKHRANTDKVLHYYAKANEHYFHEYAWRMRMCSELLKFQLVPDESEGFFKLKLSDARFCRVRHCPVCQWRRSLMWKARAYKILPQVVTDYPKHRWLFITLTVKNCQIEELRENLDSMNKAFKRLTELKTWPAKGWVKSIEVTKGRDGVSAHPHLHILAMVPPSYFSRGYLSHAKWVALWQQCLRIDYQPVVHTSAIAKHHNPSLLIPEILKYQVKESDLVGDREWFLELTRQLHKSRAIAVGGILRQYMRELEEKNQDLIDESEERDEADKASLSFRWKHKLQKYNIE
ncbi:MULTISPECIES: protein rep [Nostoc]|uniref:Protein rep n=2 Tax=Nostoc TaxID=1177 RepID=A0ABR8I078_9NOSO|nr:MULTISPECIES: protein rep [Nostoc]MBD2561864.1 protein rep [Nostoc linckia FACHB-391]MBD2644872.1 protein rep [Nostoc foliaceum FACHB-393]